MAQIQYPSIRRSSSKISKCSLSRAIRGMILLILLCGISLFIATGMFILRASHVQNLDADEGVFHSLLIPRKGKDDTKMTQTLENTQGCVLAISDIANVPNRHMVTPPDGPIILTCCQTTKGPLSIAVHPTWAPLGSDRFLHMVRTGYFSSKIALFRCMSKFICQFGLAGSPELNKEYKSLKDDPQWLPAGPDHRSNEKGTKRFPKGYLAYAGAGENSRSNQLIVALNDNGRLAGGSPWEVPWGEVVGVDSFKTLDNIYTGYGEKGPAQGRLHREGSSESIANEYPLMDYITSCTIINDTKY